MLIMRYAQKDCFNIYDLVTIYLKNILINIIKFGIIKKVMFFLGWEL